MFRKINNPFHYGFIKIAFNLFFFSFKKYTTTLTLYKKLLNHTNFAKEYIPKTFLSIDFWHLFWLLPSMSQHVCFQFTFL